ncbi:ParB/RepB/Spo0J family partition protein [Thermophilibacter provencensis]|uniref:ParB/RepB/Spo0J family partition protein n=1 Tax=Thermophilibacter provencensis TaxID=1852386 RepID=A0ABT7V2K3_9ACTN|nr:ParB/RepB/Spo0J family partition protein [Thermophilibacter provencensis]MDM8270820.1 ParB/RepB/Spo0J family partition protein [Thermophilibacter provencensis]
MAKKSGLGRGLGLLVGEADAETAGMRPDSTLSLSEIKPNKGQPRKTFKPEELAELTDSIKKNGVLQPILVRKKDSGYEIVAGERRYQAAKAAGLSEVPVIIREISDEDVFKLALIENLQRSDLTPLEEARGYRRLIKDKGLTQEELAQALSKSRSAIANTLRLLDLPAEVQELVENGKLTAGHARAILAVPSEEGRIRLAEKVARESLSVRQTESLAPLFSVTERDDRPVRAPLPPSYKRAARQMRLALDTNVRVKNVRGKNKIEIEFKSEDELAHIVDLLAGPGTWSE